MAQMPEIGGKRYAGNDPAMKQVWNYIYQLEEQLRYAFNHIGSDNLEEGAVTGKHIAAESVTADKISSSAGNELNIQSNKAITLTAKDLKKKGESIAQLRIDTEKIASRVEDAEGNVSTLQQTAKGLESRVKDTEGNITTLQQTAQGLEIRAESAEETLEGLGTRVTEAEASLTVQAGQIAAKAEKTTVEDLTGRVTEAEADLTVQAGEIAARAKQTDLDKLSGRVTEAEASLTVQAGEISLKASKTEVKEAVDDIEIGGRNLLKNSKGDFVMPPQNDGTASDNYYSKSFRFDPVVGETYTFAADVEITDGDFDAISVYPYPGGTLVNAPIPENGRITHTFTVNVDTITQIRAYVGVAGSTRGNGVIFRNVKIEKGNKATDWTAAPEDLESRVLNAETAITETADEIKLKASKTEVDSLTGRITDAEAQIVTQAGEIQLTATEVSNISIGGTNILPGYADERSVSRNIRIPVRSILEPHVGKEICISFECKATIARAISMYAYQSSGISIRNTFSFTPSTTEFTRHSFKTTVYDWGQKEGLSTGEIIFHDSAGEQNYTIRKVKIELGNKPTDWSPCPDDPVKTLKNTAMTLNGNGIEMSTTGHFRLYANDGKNSRIKLGGDDETANFSVTEDGILGAIKGEFTQGLTVKNSPVWTQSNLIVSSSEPVNVHNAIWMKPTNSIQRLVHGYTLTEDINFVRDQYSNVTLAPKSADTLTPGGEYKYTLTAQVQRTTSYNGSESYSAIATISTSAGTVQLATVNNLVVKDWGNGELVLEGRSAVDLFGASSNATISIKVSSVTISYPNLKIKANTEITLTSENVNAPSQGIQACTVFYIP